jgi:hypothetical protein
LKNGKWKMEIALEIGLLGYWAPVAGSAGANQAIFTNPMQFPFSILHFSIETAKSP